MCRFGSRVKTWFNNTHCLSNSFLIGFICSVYIYICVLNYMSQYKKKYLTSNITVHKTHRTVIYRYVMWYVYSAVFSYFVCVQRRLSVWSLPMRESFHSPFLFLKWLCWFEFWPRHYIYNIIYTRGCYLLSNKHCIFSLIYARYTLTCE